MTRKNQAEIAFVQLMTLMVVLGGLIVLAILHDLSEPTVAALFGAILAHAGIVAYNGATKAGQTTVPTPPMGEVTTIETKPTQPVTGNAGTSSPPIN